MANAHTVAREDPARRAVGDLQGVRVVDTARPFRWRLYADDGRWLGTIERLDGEGWAACRARPNGEISRPRIFGCALDAARHLAEWVTRR